MVSQHSELRLQTRVQVVRDPRALPEHLHHRPQPRERLQHRVGLSKVHERLSLDTQFAGVLAQHVEDVGVREGGSATRRVTVIGRGGWTLIGPGTRVVVARRGTLCRLGRPTRPCPRTL